MSIDRLKFCAISALARLTVDDRHLEATSDKINEILKFVDKIESVDTEQIIPLFHPLDENQRLRSDEVSESDQLDGLQDCAPDFCDNFYLVPRVIGE